MKEVIEGLLYDTATADKIAECPYVKGGYDSPPYSAGRTEFFKTKNGRYFCVHNIENIEKFHFFRPNEISISKRMQTISLQSIFNELKYADQHDDYKRLVESEKSNIQDA